jgi:hypothetical protein
MARRKSRKRKSSEEQHSASDVMEKVADAGAAMAGGQVQAGQTARQGAEGLAKVLPDAMGMSQVKQFIHRHPWVSAGAALVLGYMVFGSALPVVGGFVRLVGGRR